MALPTSIDLQIVTPERMLVREQVDEVQVPGVSGYFGVLPGHTPLLAALSVGELWYRKGQERTYLAIVYGFAEVLPDRVTILAQLAEHAEDIDAERAEAARKRAAERLESEGRRRFRARPGCAGEVIDAPAGGLADCVRRRPTADARAAGRMTTAG